ncbi:MAG: PfkB family carbohydrate kinase [Candidatus Gygaella obscura]|nr:PfkB family carbohydrate kinase [Candidatus Gygaella obscura]
MSVIVLGTIGLDTIKTPVALKKDILGGSAVHFSMAARIFTKVHMVSCVGSDFPEKYNSFLTNRDIDLRSISVINGENFRWSGEYKKDFNCAITKKTVIGVLANFKPDITKDQRRIKNVFLANVDPRLQLSLLKKFISPGLVACDSMNYWIENSKKDLLRVLKKVQIFFCNDQEARQLTGEYNIIKASKKLLKMGPKIVLIKKGEHGVLLNADSFMVALPAFPIDGIIDATGAGDSFAGGFMGSLSLEKKITRESIFNAIIKATVIASFNVQGFGLVATAGLNKKSISKRINKYKKLFSL